MTKTVVTYNQAHCLTPTIFIYLYNYERLCNKWLKKEWHRKCAVFNPVESFRLHIYGTYLVFTATNLMLWEERDMNYAKTILFAVMMLAVGACSPKIYGTVQLIDANLQPIPPVKESPQGTVVNMINTTTTLDIDGAHQVACHFPL